MSPSSVKDNLSISSVKDNLSPSSGKDNLSLSSGKDNVSIVTKGCVSWSTVLSTHTHTYTVQTVNVTAFVKVKHASEKLSAPVIKVDVNYENFKSHLF